MGIFAQKAPEVGFQAASSVIESKDFSALNKGLAQISAYGEAKSASDAAQATGEAKAAGANLFIDQAIATDKLDMQTEQSIGFAGTDADLRAAAVQQGKTSKALARVQNLIDVKNAVNDYGYAALEGFKGASGEGLAATNKGMYIEQSEESKAVEKQQADVDSYLKLRFIDTIGLSATEKEMKMQTDVIRQRTLLNATETAALNTKNSENFFNDNAGLVGTNMSGGFSAALDEIQANQDPKAKQQLLNNLIALDPVRSMQGAGYDPKTINSLIKVDANVSGKFTSMFNSLKSVYVEAAKEMMTNGTTSTATQNKLNIAKNEQSIRAMDIMDKLFGSQEGSDAMSVLGNMAAFKDTELLNTVAIAVQKLYKGDIGTNAEDIITASGIVERALEKNSNVTPAGREAISKLSKAISFKVETGNVYEQTKALSSISPQVIALLSPVDAQLVSDKVNSRIEETKTAMMEEFSKQGVEGKSLNDMYVIQQSHKTGKLWMTPKPNVDIPPDLNNSVLNTSFKGLIEASIKARTVLNGGDEAEAIEFVTGKRAQRAPVTKPETKTSSLDTQGLSEPDLMDIQSYILELKAKAQRQTAVA